MIVWKANFSEKIISILYEPGCTVMVMPCCDVTCLLRRRDDGAQRLFSNTAHAPSLFGIHRVVFLK